MDALCIRLKTTNRLTVDFVYDLVGNGKNRIDAQFNTNNENKITVHKGKPFNMTQHFNQKTQKKNPAGRLRQ